MRSAHNYTPKQLPFRSIPLSLRTTKRQPSSDRSTDNASHKKTFVQGSCQAAVSFLPIVIRKPDVLQHVYNPIVLTPVMSQDTPKSNAQLLDDLASGADLAAKTVEFVGTQISWWDTIDDKGNGGFMTVGKPTIHGGRFGKDAEHTVEDVPNHYVRDRIMDYINEQVEESKRDKARRAVFSDLSEEDIAQYSALIAAERKPGDQPIPAGKKRDAVHMKTGRVTKRRKTIQNTEEAVHMIEQEMAVAEVEEVDLGPRPDCGIRDEYAPKYSTRSVVNPGLKCRLHMELPLKPDARIDRDCDQMRTMIKQFTDEGNEWSLDDFRLALGSIDRKQLTTFMENSGPKAGKRSTVYPLAWDFFNLREQMGLPVPGGKTFLKGSSCLRAIDLNAPKLRDRMLDECFCEE